MVLSRLAMQPRAARRAGPALLRRLFTSDTDGDRRVPHQPVEPTYGTHEPTGDELLGIADHNTASLMRACVQPVMVSHEELHAFAARELDAEMRLEQLLAEADAPAGASAGAPAASPAKAAKEGKGEPGAPSGGRGGDGKDAGEEEDEPITRRGDTPWGKAITVAIYFGLGYITYGAYQFLTEVPPGATLAVELAEKNEEIKNQVGTPLSLSYFWGGKSERDQLVAELPVTGPKGKATLRVRAVRTQDGWQMLLLDAIVNGQWQTPISVLEDAFNAEKDGQAAQAAAPAPVGAAGGAAAGLPPDIVDGLFVRTFLDGYLEGGESKGVGE
mmetsp:Transcript_30432/g.59574  ORF Transcript_30432/g.59574 Transcript_30432/m.59574 type:complete len:329 (+) Transcript_30432:2-988(+)